MEKKIAEGSCSMSPSFAELVSKYGTASCDARWKPVDGNYPCFDEFWDYYPGSGCREEESCS